MSSCSWTKEQSEERGEMLAVRQQPDGCEEITSPASTARQQPGGVRPLGLVVVGLDHFDL
jgi:hypothetical protein